MSSKCPVPPWVAEHIDQSTYQRWLEKKTKSLRARDRKRGGTYTLAQGRDAIHAAVAASRGRDHWTGEQLDWSLLGTYNNEESARRGGAYKREFALLPTVDHRDNKPEAVFVICGWRTNDSKHDMTIEELVAFCQAVLRHQGVME